MAPGHLIRVASGGARLAGPVKADYRVVAKGMSPAEAFRAVCAACVQHVEANRLGALAAADPEYLHQMRVALRRLRTAFEAFEDAVPEAVASQLIGEVRWLGRALGRARDWDVFIAATLKPAVSARPRHPGLRALRTASVGLAAEARVAAHRALQSQRYFALMRALRALSYADEARSSGSVRALPIGARAPAVISAMYALARKRGRGLAHLGVKDLHRLRNAVRRLRYGVLFLETVLPEVRARALAFTVEALQETLGGINDCAVARELLSVARVEARGPQRKKARKLMKRRIEASRSALHATLERQWGEFRAAEKAWSRCARV